MPHMPNWKYAEQVGQGKKYNDVVDLYSDHYGRYDCCAAEEAKLKPGKDKPSMHKELPFALNKK